MREAGFAVAIKTDQPPSIVEFDPNKDSLKFLQDSVGGCIDRVATRIEELDLQIDMWVHDEGLVLSLPVNKLATQIHETRVGNKYACICGDVVITAGPDEEGYTIALSNSEAIAVLNWVNEMDMYDFIGPHFYMPLQTHGSGIILPPSLAPEVV